MRMEIKISGYGGQGVITLGSMLTEGAVYFKNLSAVQTSAYGVASRGGACWSEVVVSDEEIGYPRATKPDYAIIFSQEAADKYGKFIKDDGVIIYDSSIVKELHTKKGVKVYGIPATKLSVNELGRPLHANMIILGFFITLTKMMTKDDVKKLIESRFPKHMIEANLKAFEMGCKLAETTKPVKP